MKAYLLAEMTSDEIGAVLAGGAVALLPIGSVEPHGPHLPLATDLLISRSVSLAASSALRDVGVVAVVLPAVPFGVTEFARGFPGAVSVSPAALTAFLRSAVESLLEGGYQHVCLVNNHLEPDHDLAVREAIVGLAAGRASVASPLTRRWARTLSAEFKTGACHAGQYETSLVHAIAPGEVRGDLAERLDDLSVSLSSGIRDGLATFRAMGMDRAYTGSPRSATAVEGQGLLSRLAHMVVVEVTEALTVSGSLKEHP